MSTLRIWISNLEHRIKDMEADGCSEEDFRRHVAYAFTDIQWALRELASQEEGAQDAKPKAEPGPWPPGCTQPCMAVTNAQETTGGTRWRTSCSKCGYDNLRWVGMWAPEKPQAVADAQWATGQGATAAEARARCAEDHVRLLRNDIAEAASLLRDAYNRGIQHHVVWAKKPCALELGTASKESPLKCTCGVWELDARIAAFLEHHEPDDAQGGGSAGRSE